MNSNSKMPLPPPSIIIIKNLPPNKPAENSYCCMQKLLLLLSIPLTDSLPHPIWGELKEYKLLLILKLYC